MARTARGRDARAPVPEATVSRLPLVPAGPRRARRRPRRPVSVRRPRRGGRRHARRRSARTSATWARTGPAAVGYDAAYLIHQIRRELGLTQHWPIVIVGDREPRARPRELPGVRRAGVPGRGARGRRPGEGGRDRGRAPGPAVRRPRAIVARRTASAIGVIATPATAAQEVADRMVEAGLRSILNFAPAVVAVPRGVTVRKVDLAIELQILAYYEQRNAALREVRRSRGGSLRDREPDQERTRPGSSP